MMPLGGPEILRFQEWILRTCQGNKAIREVLTYLLDLIEEPSARWSAVVCSGLGGLSFISTTV